MDNLLTVSDVAALLRVTRSTIYRYKKLGIPHFKIGKSLRFTKEQVMDWVKSHQVKRVAPSSKGWTLKDEREEFYSWAENLAKKKGFENLTEEEVVELIHQNR